MFEIEEQKLKRYLGNTTLYFFDVIDSTNNQAKRLAKDGITPPFCVVSKSQTSGRGRMDRRFESNKGGIYLSVCLDIARHVATPGIITCAAAVATSKAIEDILNEFPKIKWVNDLYLNNKKVCGILAESIFDTTLTKQYIIIGIGVNIDSSVANIPPELQNTVGSIPSNNKDISQITATIINNVLSTDFDNNKKIIDDYKSRSLMIDKTITFHDEIGNHSATCLDIAPNGELIVIDTNNIITKLSSGEVQIIDIQGLPKKRQ